MAAPMNPQLIGMLISLPLMAWGIYRRVRSSFGRQPIRTKRMVVRIVILSLVVVGFAIPAVVAPLASVQLVEGLLGGLLVGGLVGYAGLRLTRFETTPEGDRFIPNPWLGAVVTALFLGRVAYRFVVASTGATAVAAQGHPPIGNSPLTMLVLGLTFGYYICYYAGLLVHHRRWKATAPAGVVALD